MSKSLLFALSATLGCSGAAPAPAPTPSLSAPPPSVVVAKLKLTARMIYGAGEGAATRPPERTQRARVYRRDPARARKLYELGCKAGSQAACGQIVLLPSAP